MASCFLMMTKIKKIDTILSSVHGCHAFSKIISFSKPLCAPSMSRPLRSARLPMLPPSLPEIMARVILFENNIYDNVRKEFLAVSKYFKGDIDQIAAFWFEYYDYNYDNANQCLLLQCLVSNLGFQHPFIKRMLDTILRPATLHRLGVVRCIRKGVTYYRIFVGGAV